MRYVMSHLGHIVGQQMTVRYINSFPFRLAPRDPSKLPQNEMSSAPVCSEPVTLQLVSFV
jgi:hypothetical protein